MTTQDAKHPTSPRTMTQEYEDSYRALAEDSGKRGAAVNVVVEGALAMLDELDAERAAHAKTLDVLAALANAACDADEYVAIMAAEAHLEESGR